MRSSFGWLASASGFAMLGVMGVSPTPASAQSVFTGTLTSTDKSELVSWSTLFWQRVADGGGSPGAGFAFTNAQLNSPLFSPLRATRPTLEKVGLVSSGDCDKLGTALPINEASVSAVWKLFQDAMLEGKIATDWASDTSGTIQHANLILATPTNTGLTVFVDGTALVSLNLPLEKVNAVAYEASLKNGLSQTSQDIIASIIASSAQWASNAGTVTEAQKLITGQASRADNFAATAQDFFRAIGYDRGSVATITAQFGVFGALPVTVIALDDCMFLLDPLNGNFSGPFETDSKLDATGLLSAYPSVYTTDMSVAYYNAQGCPIVAAPYPTPVTHPALPTWPGILPGHWIPQPPRATDPPGTLPGRPTAWVCLNVTMVGGATCVCTRTVYHVIGNIDPNHPATVPIRVPEIQQCSTPGFCGNTTPPAAPATLPAGCTNSFWY